MFKYIPFYFLFLAFYINTSHAYYFNVIKQSPTSFVVRGEVNESDLVTTTAIRSLPGVNVWYYPKAWSNAGHYQDFSKNCPDNAEQAVRIINKELAYMVVKYEVYANPQNSTMYITCNIRENLSWVFDGYIGEAVNPDAASCKVSAPLDVNFGMVQVGDNNKVIEKQVTIKCDKKTAMRLTLQGDNKTNLLTLSDTVIKLGVDGDAQTKDYNVEEGKVTTANLMFTLSDTGDVPGVKKGYALLISEIP